MSFKPIVEKMLNDVLPTLNSTSAGKYYVPSFVQNNKYDPYGPFVWPFTITDQTVKSAANQICPTIGIQTGKQCPNPPNLYIGAPDKNPELKLSNCSIIGLSNAKIASWPVSGPDGFTIAVTIDFGKLPAGQQNPPPHKLVQLPSVVGDFSFTQYCCCSNKDQTACVGPPDAQTGTGTFVANIQQSPSVTCVIQITKLEKGVLDLNVEKVTFAVPNSPNDNAPDIDVTITIKSIPKGAKGYSKMAETVFNSADARVNFLKQINDSMDGTSEKSTFTKILTGVTDGYLQDNHLYPFNGATLSLF
jgi:hypothetical protein